MGQSSSSPTRQGGSPTWLDADFAPEFVHSEVGADNFDFVRPIAHGGFGEVFLAQERASGAVFAIKVMDKQAIRDMGLVAQTKAEKNIQEMIGNHPYIVNLRAAFQTKEKVCIVLDYVGGGDMFELLKSCKVFSLDRARLYAAETAMALDFLHQKGVMYRDLKLENILIDSEGHVRLCDFGLAKQVVLDDDGNTRSVSSSTYCGTKEYMSPEMLMPGLAYGIQVDWWAFGVFVYAMITGKYPFYARTVARLEAKISGSNPWFPPQMDEDAVDLISRLLRKNPRHRLTFAEIQDHPFFDGIDWDRVAVRDYVPEYLPAIELAGLPSEEGTPPFWASSSPHSVVMDGGASASSITGPVAIESSLSFEQGLVIVDSPIEAAHVSEARSDTEEAIRACRCVIPEDEEYMSGFVIISINKWNFEQMRVLLISNTAFYRIKYAFAGVKPSDPPSKAIHHVTRTALADIMEIQTGPVHDSKLSTLITAGTRPVTAFAMRIVSSSENLRRSVKARVFCPLVVSTGNPEHDMSAQRDLTDQVVGTLLAARDLVGAGTIIPEDVQLHRETLSTPTVRVLPRQRQQTPEDRLRDLATSLTDLNAEIADAEAKLQEMRERRDAMRHEVEELREQCGVDGAAPAPAPAPAPAQ